MQIFNFLHKIKITTLNQLLKNLFNFLLLISIILCVMYCLLRVLNIFESAIVYAEDFGTSKKLENYTSSEELAKFARDSVNPVAKKQPIGVPLSDKGKPDPTQLGILGGDLIYYKHNPNDIYCNMEELSSKKNLIHKNSYVGSFEKVNKLMYQLYRDEILTHYEQLPPALKQNNYAHNKLINSGTVVLDNIEKPHNHVIIEYEGSNNKKIYQGHTITTNPITYNHPVIAYIGQSVNTDYIHAGNSPFIELAEKEKDSYVTKMPKIFYFDDFEIKKYQLHFSKKIMLFQAQLHTFLETQPGEASAIEYLQQTLAKNNNLHMLLHTLGLIPNDLFQITMSHVNQLDKISPNLTNPLIYDIFTNIPNTKLSNTAQPVFNTIFKQLETQKLIPPLSTLNIPTIQFDYTPHKYGLNSNAFLSFKSTNYSFLMKTIARIQQLM